MTVQNAVRATVVYAPGNFEPVNHFYPRVPNSTMHPLVKSFLSLGNERLAQRYCHLHPAANRDAVLEALRKPTRYLRWAGADLFHVTTAEGVRRNVIVEVNSSPSGQKSMPLRDTEDELGGYRSLLQHSFMPLLKRRRLPAGRLAVLWDKNEMEVTGYAAAMADLSGEAVLLVHCPPDPTHETTRMTADGVLEVHDENGQFVPVRAAFRYVTQRPWTRLPPVCRTAFLNPVLACLAGGRNKALAAKAYDFYNAEIAHTGLRIRTPKTVWDVGLEEVPHWVERMGGIAVVKNPYSNAGQGVYTIGNQRELDAFMKSEQRYDRFIVQALIGNSAWSSQGTEGRFYHVGTVPDRNQRIFVADVRLMVGSSPDGFRPIAMYARRARKPLTDVLDEHSDTWSMLGTNLSVKTESGFSTEPERLMLMDNRDFNRLGVGLDDLTEAYLQTVLSVTAIDRMAERLINSKGRFRHRLFGSFNPDPALSAEIFL